MIPNQGRELIISGLYKQVQTLKDVIKQFRRKKMKKLAKLILVIGFIVLFVVSAYAYEDGDWQYWNTEEISGKLVDIGTNTLDTIEAKIEGEWRFGDDASEFYYQHADVGLNFKKLFVPWFNFGVFYRQVWEYKHSSDDNYWFDEYRPHFDPEVSFKVDGWSIKDRFRVELRYFDEDISGKDDVVRLRNKLTIKPPAKWTEWAITPYVADEIFWEEHEDGIYRNRLYLGLEISKLFNLETLKGDIYFMWQASDNGDNWTDKDVYALGTKLKVHF